MLPITIKIKHEYKDTYPEYTYPERIWLQKIVQPREWKLAY